MVNDPNVTAVVNDAKAAGITLLGDAKTAATVILTHLSSAMTGGLPDIETAAFSTLLDFVPSSYRGVVSTYATPAVDAAEATYTPELQAAIKGGVGLALGRIDAVLDSMVSAIGPVTLSATTTAPPRGDSPATS
jgi:NaMN:DMB phosphoribosyltransferase